MEIFEYFFWASRSGLTKSSLAHFTCRNLIIAIFDKYFYIGSNNPQLMTFFTIIILGIVIFYLITKYDKQPSATQNGLKNNQTYRNTVQGAAPINIMTKTVQTQPSKPVTIYGNENMVRKLPVFQDETIIEVLPEPVRIASYDEYSNNFENRSVYTPTYDPDEYKLGKRYKEKLNLSKQEVVCLNKLWPDRNVFNSIEGCEMEVVKLYLATLKKLNANLKKESRTFAGEIEPLIEKTAEYQRSTYQYWTDFSLNDAKKHVESSVHQHIYRKSESIIREKWNHKRKIQTDFINCGTDTKALFDERLGLLIDAAMSKATSIVGEPDDDTSIALNETGTGRWKIQFEQITNACNSENLSETIAQLYRIGKLNAKNLHVEHVYFEASKFLATHDKLESLKFYLHYIWHDLNSKQVDNKQLNRTIQKKIFSKQEELDSFQSIVDQLVKSKNLPQALTDVSGIYTIKRKQIALDISAVKVAEKEHAGTVEILSEYLRDDIESAQSVSTESAQSDEVTIKINRIENVLIRNDEPQNVTFSTLQSQCLIDFEENGFTLSFDAVESFAKANGLFKNQLIDGINDRCMDLLDDVLIEETEEGFEVNINYYKQIFAA